MFTLPPLPYDYAALEPFIDTETMRIHHTKHHAAYVQNLNDALKGRNELLDTDIFELIGSLKKIPAELQTRVRNQGGGHLNHSLFWKLMTPKPAKAPSHLLMSLIKKSFKGFSQFQELFTLAAMARFGSGWAWLVVNKKKLEIMDTPNQDSPLTLGQTPILALDVWEHAYYLRYQNRRADYIDAWWNVVNWEEVENLYHQALKKKKAK